MMQHKAGELIITRVQQQSSQVVFSYATLSFLQEDKVD